jgi:hypothetical protein
MIKKELREHKDKNQAPKSKDKPPTPAKQKKTKKVWQLKKL